jgi:LmbE family N-acetylglucosaminyl deacetylase
VDLFLAPHNDDEALFGAYTCLRRKPLVVVCLRSFVEATWEPPGPTYHVREAETDAACSILDVPWRQLHVRDDEPDWDQLADEFLDIRDNLQVRRVYAPWPEEGGHPHHNEIGELAGLVWDEEVWYYTTYTHAGGRTTGPIDVPVEPGWEDVKRRALACYRSQREHPRTRGGFLWPLDEYLVRDYF